MNDTRTITHTWAVAREGFYSLVAADLEAMRCKLILAQQKGWRKIELKLDVKAMVTCVQREISPNVESLTLTEDIFLLVFMFEDRKFDFEQRKFHKSCARLATIDHRVSHAWCGVLSDWLWRNIVEQDARSVGLM